MGVISTNKHLIKLFYNSESALDREIQAYVFATERQVFTIDISKTKVTGTQWVELAKGLNLQIADLINKEHPNFMKNYSKAIDLDDGDWLKVLENHPEVLSAPIAIIGEKFVQLHSPSDFIKYIEPDSKM